METIGIRICRRCRIEKPEREFFQDDRGNWCMLCTYTFLKAHADEPEYQDSRDFTHPDFRGQARSPIWVLNRLEIGLKSVGVLSESKPGSPTPARIPGYRTADATRLPGERALLCEHCQQKFGGETVFKAHRKYGNKRGRPAKDAQLKCFSLENSRFSKDENGVWRGATPNFDYRNP